MARLLALTASAAGMMLLILDSRASAAAAADAVDICIRTVIPGLFPFFLLSGYLTRSLRGGKSIARLFRSGDNCGSVILTGLLGGYPVGAKLAAEGFRYGSLTKEQADRLLTFCSQAGPSFLFGMVASQFDGLGNVWALWAIQICSALSVANLFPGQDISTASHTLEATKTSDPMHSALKAMATVCGWVIIFSVIISFLKRWVLWLLPEEIQVLFCGLLELTSGCLRLREIESVPLRFIAASVVLNFGGICVMMQTASVSEGLKFRNYFTGKLLQTVLSLLYTLLFLGKWAAIIPIVCIFFAKSLRIPGKRYSIPMKNGV